MYFPEMVTYNYRLPFYLNDVQCVGWIDSAHDFDKGEDQRSLVERLERLVRIPSSTFGVHVNIVRGIHPCNFCRKDIGLANSNGVATMLGMSEIWIPSRTNYLGAPSLILHYISEHGYRPPDSFAQSVFALDIEKVFL